MQAEGSRNRRHWVAARGAVDFCGAFLLSVNADLDRYEIFHLYGSRYNS